MIEHDVGIERELERLRALVAMLAERVRELHARLGEPSAAEPQLVEAEAAAAGFMSLMETIDSSCLVGFAVVDRDLRFVRVNQGLVAMNGMSVAEHIGARAEALLPELWPQLAPAFRQVLETGQSVLNHLVTADGNGGPRGRWLDSFYPVRIDGKVAGVGVIVLDVTDKFESEEFLHAVTETIVEGMYSLDAEGRLTYMNAAASRMLGWSFDELRGRSMHDAIHFQNLDGTLLPERDCPILRTREQGIAVNHGESAFTRRDGSSFPVSFSAAPLRPENHARGVVVVFRDISEEHAEQIRAEQELEQLNWIGRTREAMDEERLTLYSQPIVPLTGEEPSEELLLRMVSRDGEVIPPGEFLPAAERFGLIVEIDRWVIAQAARLAAEDRRVEVNLSPRSISSGLIDYIRAELRDAGADPANLIFELTETALMEDMEAGQRFAAELNALGCPLALDDFGTGFAGLAYLKHIPADYLKIDIEFVRDLTESTTNQHLVNSIVHLARGLGKRTVAEGIEDEETLELLRSFGVDAAQGYHLGRPAPLESRLDTAAAS
jgi:PAS domain S-box-containing protein